MGANGTLSDAAVAAAAEERPEGEDGEAMIFRGSNYSLPRTIAALALWLGGIHFNVILILASLFLFPLRLAALCVPSPSYLFRMVPFFNCCSSKRPLFLPTKQNSIFFLFLFLVCSCPPVHVC
jgi:hypothetical protein